jgi:hypothetical protein
MNSPRGFFVVSLSKLAAVMMSGDETAGSADAVRAGLSAETLRGKADIKMMVAVMILRNLRNTCFIW